MPTRDLELERADMQIGGHLNQYEQKHGDEKVPAWSFDLLWTTDNNSLAHFGPDLKASFYTRSDEDSGGLVGDHDPTHMTARKNTVVKMPLRADGDMTGATVTLHREVSGRDLVLKDARVSKFRLDCLPGGSVKVAMQVQVTQLSEATSGALSMLMGKVLQVSIEPLKVGIGDLTPARPTTAPKRKGKMTKAEANDALTAAADALGLEGAVH